MAGSIRTGKEFNRFSIAVHDFEKAIEFLNESTNHDESSLAHEALLISAVLLYWRPFSPNEKDPSARATARIKIESFKGLTEEELGLHELCGTLRNKALAHAEWLYNPTRVAPETGIITSRRHNIISEPINWEALRRLAEKLREQCHHSRADYISQNRLS